MWGHWDFEGSKYTISPLELLRKPDK